MKGNEIFEIKYNDKIKYVINKNKDIECLQGFVNSINNRRSCTSVYSYLNIVIKFIRTTNKDVSKLKYNDYINYLSDYKNKTSSYQITIYAALKKFSEYLYASELSSKNYMKDIEIPKMREGINTKNKREIGFLNTDEIIKYINNVKNCAGETHKASSFRENNYYRDLSIILILLNTGMRCSALWKLNIDSINFNNNSLITIEKEEVIREYFISDYVMSILKQWMLERDKIIEGAVNENALFVSRNKTRLSRETIAQIVNKYSFNIDGKHITPHKLRATYGTQLYNNTHDLYMVQQCMGHCSPVTTEKYIRGKEDINSKRASEIMSSILF